MMYKLYIYIYSNQICSAVSGKKRKRKKKKEYFDRVYNYGLGSCMVVPRP